MWLCEHCEFFSLKCAILEDLTPYVGVFAFGPAKYNPFLERQPTKVGGPGWL